MTQGLQCWDASGNLVLDVTDRLTRVLGVFKTGVQDGSITDANLASGTPWYSMRKLTTAGLTDANCVVSFSGNTISWTFGAIGSRVESKIIYGVF